jgi:hypothetical protein
MMNSLAQRRRFRRVSLGHFIKNFSMPYSKFDLPKADKRLLAYGALDVGSAGGLSALGGLTSACSPLASSTFLFFSF